MAGCIASWSARRPTKRRAAADSGPTSRRWTLEPGDNRTNDLADRDLLERAFARISLEHRAVVVLRHYADLPLAEVAHALGVPLGTAKSRYHYAMSELRTAIEAEGRLVTAAEGRA